jgi:integrase
MIDEPTGVDNSALAKQSHVTARVRSLPIDCWPNDDREKWAVACRPGLRLRRGGSASHLKPITQKDFDRRYGYFLDFMDRSGKLDLDAPAGLQVTPANVDAYLAELKTRVSSVTLQGSIYKLRRITQLIAPNLDLRWLIEIESDLALVMEPRSKNGRLVLSHVLVEAGLTLITEADGSGDLSLFKRAIGFRNGLMVALLALYPIRIKNFAALEIGRTLAKVNDVWWILLPASETKEGRDDERRIDQIVAGPLDRYIAVYRPILARKDSTSNALWISANDGQPMGESGVARAITSTTLSTVGVSVSPHLFRMSAASTAAMRANDHPRLGSAILHHRSRAITDKNYNRATTMSAMQNWHSVLREHQCGK